MVQSIKTPLVGLGTWKIPLETAATVVETAIQTGYRLIDCACDYGNEEQVGLGIQKAIEKGHVKREQLFVTSKLWNSFHARQHVRMACERSLKDLKLDYLDLYLIHFPIPTAFVDPSVRYPPGWSVSGKDMTVTLANVSLRETWQAMEELVKEGLVKHIGVSNFNYQLLADLLTFAEIKPFMNQVELHPYLQQTRLREFCTRNGISVTAFSSFGGVSYVPLGVPNAINIPSLLDCNVIQSIAKKYTKTPAQILLKWATQQDVCVIPKSTHVARLQENLNLDDFELDPHDFEQIATLDSGIRFNDPGQFANIPIYA